MKGRAVLWCGNRKTQRPFPKNEKLLDADLLHAMGNEARKAAEKFTMERFIRELTLLYSAIMEEKTARQRSSR